MIFRHKFAPVPKLSIFRERDKHSCKISHISNVGMLSTLSNISQSYFALFGRATNKGKERFREGDSLLSISSSKGWLIKSNLGGEWGV